MNTRAGRVGDLIAAAAIERLGGMPAIVRTDGCDIIVHFDSRWYRVEVKATGKPSDRYTYHFNVATGSASKKSVNPNQCDVLALVALDIRLCYFLPVVEAQQKTKRIRVGLFNTETEADTWSKSISRVQK
jgi:hypothetical protein